jgi:hypothetical protein
MPEYRQQIVTHEYRVFSTKHNKISYYIIIISQFSQILHNYAANSALRKLAPTRKIDMTKITRLLSFRLSLLAPLLLLLHVTAASAQAPDVYINEIQVSTAGTDWEFVELRGAPGTDLSDLTLLGVESDAGSSTGRIDRAISLAGQSIPADGYWLAISAAGSSEYGVSGELAIANNTFENSTATYFLVTGFTGAVGNDVDTNDDGILDATPWGVLVDAINLRCQRRRLRRNVDWPGRLIPALRRIPLRRRATRHVRWRHSQFQFGGWNAGHQQSPGLRNSRHLH